MTAPADSAAIFDHARMDDVEGATSKQSSKIWATSAGTCPWNVKRHDLRWKLSAYLAPRRTHALRSTIISPWAAQWYRWTPFTAGRWPLSRINDRGFLPHLTSFRPHWGQ